MRAAIGPRIWALAILLLTLEGRADPAADIAQIHLEAIGGRARLAALKGLRMSGTVIVAANEQRMRFSMIAVRPSRVRLEIQQKGRTLVTATDGIEPPWEFDTGSWPPRYRDMEASAARGFLADAEFDDPLVAGAARGFSLDYAGETEVGGRKLLRVLATKSLTETFTLLVDPETYFIAMRVEQRTTAAGRKRQIVTRYDDFRPVEGVLLPFRITILAEGRIEQQMIVERIEANPEITPETFTRPKPGPAEKKAAGA